MKKMISLRLEETLIQRIKETGSGLTEFITKAATTRLNWLDGQRKKLEEEKISKEDLQILQILQKAKEQWKKDN